ncbi:protein kinase [Streptomyces litchfieldiae]|uniref:Protein kinase n=1 Tax=Streptomyces litchfieldiae TaxID=3075543 RepID=A0ABU2MZA9_9ACTN|nr:protein kinase [Streptomyces sp. DSM 44938]MDT0345849.1 protein kinase [Streptomyces sp. DSM 44938]
MTRNPGPEFWALIHPHTGDPAGTRHTSRGDFSDLTTVVECEKGPFFVKAMRNRPGGRYDSIIREKLINPFVQPICPALLWTAEDEEWIALGFEVVDGRQPDIGPGSSDLPAIVDLLNQIGELGLPEIARDWHETRWDRFTGDETEAELFRGDALLHADINHTNLLIGERAWAVDWGWPTRGAAFIDPAMLVIQFVAAGHSPRAAEAWAANCEAWANADPEAIDAFAAAKTRMWWQLAWQRPDRPSRKALAEAAEAWANHRGVTVL